MVNTSLRSCTLTQQYNHSDSRSKCDFEVVAVHTETKPVTKTRAASHTQVSVIIDVSLTWSAFFSASSFQYFTNNYKLAIISTITINLIIYFSEVKSHTYLSEQEV